MLSADPPLLLNFQCFLEVKEEVGTRHGSSGEKVRAHPTLFKIIGCCSVCKDVYEEFSSWPQRFGDFVHQQLVVLHMLKQFDWDNPIKTFWLELVIYHISSDDRDIGQTLAASLGLNVLFLRTRIGEGSYLSTREDLGEVQSARTPTAAS